MKNNNIIIYSIIFILFFIIFNYNNIEKLNNTNSEIIKLDTNICSKNCCNFTQWLPEHMKNKNLNSNYLPSNYSCNFGSNSGCVCVTKDDKEFIENHGQFL